MSQVYFTLIIPTFNSAYSLGDCLQSVISQDFNNYEIVIQDGGSTDNTLEIVKKYKDSHSRIKLFSEADTGVYNAMNKGIDKASGEWVYFLGSDDELVDSAVLKDVKRFISIHPDADLVYGDVISTRFSGIYDGEFDIMKLLSKNISHQAIFYKKELFNKIGLFNENFIILADHDFNLRCFLSGSVTHYYLNRLIANYADGGISSVSTFDSSFHEKFWERIVIYILNSNLGNNQVKKLLIFSYGKVLKINGLKKTLEFSFKTIFKKPLINFIAFKSAIAQNRNLWFQ
jgi:glycosyltransferase involved in cell wall biosynthesis